MSVRVTLNCLIKNGMFQQVKPFLEANLSNVRGFDGCLKVEVLYDEDKQEMLLDEEWLTKGHHQAYLRFIAENGVLDQLSAFLIDPPDIKYFSKVEV